MGAFAHPPQRLFPGRTARAIASQTAPLDARTFHLATLGGQAVSQKRTLRPRATASEGGKRGYAPRPGVAFLRFPSAAQDSRRKRTGPRSPRAEGGQPSARPDGRAGISRRRWPGHEKGPARPGGPAGGSATTPVADGWLPPWPTGSPGGASRPQKAPARPDRRAGRVFAHCRPASCEEPRSARWTSAGAFAIRRRRLPSQADRPRVPRRRRRAGSQTRTACPAPERGGLRKKAIRPLTNGGLVPTPTPGPCRPSKPLSVDGRFFNRVLFGPEPRRSDRGSGVVRNACLDGEGGGGARTSMARLYITTRACPGARRGMAVPAMSRT